MCSYLASIISLGPYNIQGPYFIQGISYFMNLFYFMSNIQGRYFMNTVATSLHSIVGIHDDSSSASILALNFEIYTQANYLSPLTVC